MPTPVGKTLGDNVEVKEEGGYFELLRGVHQEGGFHYTAGEIIPSKSNLEKHNVSGKGAEKFRKATKEEYELSLPGAEFTGKEEAEDSESGEPTTSQEMYDAETLASLNKAELRDIVRTFEGVKVRSSDSEQQLIDKILQAQSKS